MLVVPIKWRFLQCHFGDRKNYRAIRAAMELKSECMVI